MGFCRRDELPRTLDRHTTNLGASVSNNSRRRAKPDPDVNNRDTEVKA
jgi:hypothetical protein